MGAARLEEAGAPTHEAKPAQSGVRPLAPKAIACKAHLWFYRRTAAVYLFSIGLPRRLEPQYPGLEVVTTPSPTPPVVVQCWCGMVQWMNRRLLDRSTRDIWKRFDHGDLKPLKRAIIRRRRVLAYPVRP